MIHSGGTAYDVTVAFRRPLTAREHAGLADDTHPMPHLRASWRPVPGSGSAGVIRIRGRDALTAGYAALGWMYAALPREVDPKVSAVMPATAPAGTPGIEGTGTACPLSRPDTVSGGG